MISDEIRELAGEAGIYSNACVKLRELADRIDRETVELPRDRHGEIIHIGDTVYRDGVDKLEVYGINIIRHALIVACMNPDGETCPCFPTDVTHDRSDSLGRIADDIEARLGTGTIDGSTLSKWVGRIRKLAKEGE